MPSSAAGQSRILVQVDHRLAGSLLAVCALVLIAKLWLVTRININWDEFYFLSEIHALARGDLHSSFQTAYTRLFAWLPQVGTDEVARINAARTGMWLLLGLSAWLLFRLARRWASAPAAALGVLAFLVLAVTLRHGASFRVDALLLPLQLAALLALTQPGWDSARRGAVAGALLGIACVVSIKAVLLAPLVLALLLLPGGAADESPRFMVARLRGGLWLVAVAAVLGGALLAAHHLSLRGPAAPASASQVGAPAPAQPAGLPAQSVAERARDAWQRTIAEAEFLPRAAVLREQLRADPLFWLLAAAGLAVALARRNWVCAASALALLPVLFYRNAFAYYFVVMLAPLAVLVATAADAALGAIRDRAPPRMAAWAVGGVAFAFVLQAGSHLLRLGADQQVEQRRLVAGVHAMFPQPVPYLDHSGMISAFPKANFFMTSWGMERYREAGRGFVRDALLRHRAPLLVENRTELRVGSARYALLLAEDRALIERFYLPYWGPVRVAGVSTTLAPGGARRIELPFPGAWRLRSAQPVTVAGERVVPGGVFTVAPAAPVGDADLGFPAVEVELAGDAPGAAAEFTVVWAGAGAPPPGPPPHPILYDRL